jgi:hypothetical protein
MPRNSQVSIERRLAEVLFPMPDRRASPRLRTVCFDAIVERNGASGLFRVRNVSDTGIMLNTHVPLEVGESVTIVLADQVAVPGTVIWGNERCCGVQFERAIDSAALLRAEALWKRGDRRGGALRLAAMRLATSYGDNGIRAVKVVNASHRGMGLAHDGTLEPGMELKLTVDNGIERTAMVRWSRAGRAGVRLLEPLSCQELERVASYDRIASRRAQTFFFPGKAEDRDMQAAELALPQLWELFN